MIKFIHAADIHLDSPLLGLERYEGAPVDQVRRATRRALENMVDLAHAEKVDLLLIAGDLYDGALRDYNTILYLNKQLSRLGGLPVCIVKGNHDADSIITRSLSLPNNVHVFESGQASTKKFNDLRVAVHGRSFASRETDADFVRSYPAPLPGFINIGLLHTSASGNSAHNTYAPCSVESLVRRGYDYWALGHVHTREELSHDPLIAYPGCIQGRHIRETGPKGCLIVSGDETELTAEWRELDVMRWSVAEVDASGAGDARDVVERAEALMKSELAETDDRPLALRLVISGATPAHVEMTANREYWRNEFRGRATDVGLDQLWLEKIIFSTTPDGLETSGTITVEKADLDALLPEWKENVIKPLREKAPDLFTTDFDPESTQEVEKIFTDAAAMIAGKES